MSIVYDSVVSVAKVVADIFEAEPQKVRSLDGIQEEENRKNL